MKGAPCVAPVKDLFRAIEKSVLMPVESEDDHNTGEHLGQVEQFKQIQAQNCGRIQDVVRAQVTCVNMGGVAAVLSHLLEASKQGQDIQITRVKNRFDNPTSGGWCDVLVNFHFLSDDREHICELQICHQAFTKAREENGGERSHASFRAAEEMYAFGVHQSGGVAKTGAVEV